MLTLGEAYVLFLATCTTATITRIAIIGKITNGIILAKLPRPPKPPPEEEVGL
jgi:hypothetical protein